MENVFEPHHLNILCASTENVFELHHRSILFASTILMSVAAGTLTNGIIGPGGVGADKIKYVVLVLTVFLSFGFSEVVIHPITQLINTLVVCIAFVCMSRLSKVYFYICFTIVGFLLIIESFRSYYDKVYGYNGNLIMNIQLIGICLLPFICFAGHLPYFKRMFNGVKNLYCQ
jgi:hypothetical protein